jgi:hypothetical protein
MLMEQSQRLEKARQERERTTGVNNLSATLQGPHVVLSWQPPLTGQLKGEPIVRYKVKRLEGDLPIRGPLVDLGYTQEQSFVDTTAQPGKHYVYFVSAESKTYKGSHIIVKVQMPK